MNVLLIQPPDPAPAVLPHEPGEAYLFGPPWELLCLRSHLLDRTRYLCSIIDARLFTDVEQELVEAVKSLGEPPVAAVHTTTVGLGQASAVIEILKRRFPEIRVAIFGQHPSQFPQHAGVMPWVDYALAGDPEPILRNLLDYLDVEARLRRAPGLVLAGDERGTPYWLPDLRSLSLPDWQGVFWGGYRMGPRSEVCRGLARLSRGHTRCPADRAAGAGYEPLRLWPTDRMAAALQKAGHLGVTEILFVDPPGIWTPQLLDEWCRALDRVQNTQPWGLQLLPTLLKADTIDYLSRSLCRRLDFIFPSCDRKVLKRYGCIVTPEGLAAETARLEQNGIRVHYRFWLGGPEEREDEQARVFQTIRSLGFPPFSLSAFPYRLDAPLYAEHAAEASTGLEDWIRWARNPWITERPVALWGGPDAAEDVDITIELILKAARRDPRNLLKRLLATVFSRNWISFLESKAVGMMERPPAPGTKPPGS